MPASGPFVPSFIGMRRVQADEGLLGVALTSQRLAVRLGEVSRMTLVGVAHPSARGIGGDGRRGCIRRSGGYEPESAYGCSALMSKRLRMPLRVSAAQKPSSSPAIPHVEAEIRDGLQFSRI
jgi:hypothetical protein